jgi:curved DNA-binding protein CbpA
MSGSDLAASLHKYPEYSYHEHVSEPSHYEILQVDPRADTSIITLVYHALAERYRPDRAVMPDAEARMTRLNEAHRVLSDPELRSAYDQSIGVALVVIPIEAETVSMAVEQAAPTGPAYGEAGPPPTFPTAWGSVLSFGRYQNWTLSQVAARDVDYIEWLRRTPTGRQYAKEIDAILMARAPA